MNSGTVICRVSQARTTRACVVLLMRTDVEARLGG